MTAPQRPIWELMQEVPQEIFDRIHDLTFSTDSFPTGKTMTSSTRPPATTQVDRASCTATLPAYYSRRFVFTDYMLCRRWINSLSTHQRPLVVGIEYSYHPDEDLDQSGLSEMLSLMYRLPMYRSVETWEFEKVTARWWKE